MNTELLGIPVQRINGQTASLAEHEGKVMLIVNVASKCGLTPQYDGLEKIYERYRDQGLVVLGFPANEFLGQEPGTNEEIQEFCRMNFGVQFPMYQKIVVKGEGQHPLYQYLTQVQPSAQSKAGSGVKKKIMALVTGYKEGDISWNFEKFLVDRQGQVVGRFAPDVAPDDPMLVDAIEKELAV